MAIGNLPKRALLSEINVTPLVDVMLVLLIIFMVTAPMMQQGLDVELPETKSSGVEVNDKPFIVRVRADKKILLGKTPVTVNNLGEKLQGIFKTRKDKRLFLQADKSVSYGFVAEIMGEIRAAGIYNIGLVTLPKASN